MNFYQSKLHHWIFAGNTIIFSAFVRLRAFGLALPALFEEPFNIYLLFLFFLLLIRIRSNITRKRRRKKRKTKAWRNHGKRGNKICEKGRERTKVVSFRFWLRRLDGSHKFLNVQADHNQYLPVAWFFLSSFVRLRAFASGRFCFARNLLSPGAFTST